MEFLGHFTSTSKNKKNNTIDLEYSNSEAFCEATTKLMSGFKGDCRFMVASDEGERYFLNILDYRYVSTENRIVVWPENLKKYQKKIIFSIFCHKLQKKASNCLIF